MPDQTREQAEQIARRFHTTHEPYWAKTHGESIRHWEEMPESYQHRLVTTFERLVREGSVNAGAMLHTHLASEEAFV